MPFYLYGHYDSRGGATLIERDTKEEADQFYGEEVFCITEDYDWATKEERIKILCEEDFIAEVLLSSYRPLEDGEDLEQGQLEGPTEGGMANAFEDGLAWATDEVRNTTPNPYRPLLWARYEGENVKELKFCDKGHNPAYEDQTRIPSPWAGFSHPQAKQEGWRRSEFGEDACGVILMLKPTE